MQTMIPSFHDHFLISYQVDCEKRYIKFGVKTPEWADEQMRYCVEIVAVEAYGFEGDAFGNIILAFEEASIDQLLKSYSSEIAEMFHQHGAPGRSWAADMASAQDVLVSGGFKGFILSSSYGLSGWIIAKEVMISKLPVLNCGHGINPDRQE